MRRADEIGMVGPPSSKGDKKGGGRGQGHLRDDGRSVGEGRQLQVYVAMMKVRNLKAQTLIVLIVINQS